MRVLHIFYEIKYSGAEIMYANASELFQNNGIEMLALNTGKNLGDFTPKFVSVGIKVYHKALSNDTKSPIKFLRFFRWLYKFIKDKEIDVIHIHRNPYYFGFAMIGFLAGCRVIRTVHNVIHYKKIMWPKVVTERFVSSHLFKVTFQTIGQSVDEHERKYFRNQSTLINNWYDHTRFYPSDSIQEKKKLRENLGIPVDSFVIISTGGCTHVKNHHDIIRALQIINETTPCLYLHLGSGPTEEEELDLALSLKLDDKIFFLKNKDNVRDYLIASDVYIMSSTHEGLSIAAIEAMASGVPSILYNSPGLRDLITNDDNGFLIEPNYHEIASKVILYKNSEFLRQSKRTQALKYVTQNYSMKSGAKQISDLYKSNI